MWFPFNLVIKLEPKSELKWEYQCQVPVHLAKQEVSKSNLQIKSRRCFHIRMNSSMEEGI